MAAEEVMKLFDLYWFEHGILTSASTIEGRAIIADKGYLKDFLEAEAEAEAEAEPTSLVKHLALSTTKPFPRMQNEFEDAITKFDGQYLSETSSNASDSSPRSVISTRKLRKILSGKETPVKKSLSELESEELKGFKDLGFVFTEEDRKIPGLVSFVPGLQRSSYSWDGDECGISRPYLSEAWDILDQRKANRELMKWKFPDLENENDMKNHLKMWAQTVASTLR